MRKIFSTSSFNRWALVGVLTTGIDYALFLVFYSRLNSVYLANLMSGFFATSLNYFLHHRWTFKSNSVHLKSGIRYFSSLIFWWLVSTILIKNLIALGIEVHISKLIPIFLMIPANFRILNKYVFGATK